MFHLVLATLIAASPPRETAPLPHAPPLTSIHSIRRLSPEECAKKMPVRITGVVTFVNAEKVSDFFVQDSTAGIYVTPSPFAKGLKVGDRVTLYGVTDPGSFAPCVIPSAVETLGHKAPMPVGLPFNLNAEDSRWLDGQYVQTSGVVSSIRVSGPYTTVGIYSAHGRALVVFPDPKYAETMKNLQDMAVNFRGVCVPSFDPKERIITSEITHIFSNHFPMISFGADKPQAIQPILHLLRFNPVPHPGTEQVTVAGVVVAKADNTLFVQDATGGVAVRPESPAEAVRVGQRVEVIGLLGIEGRRITLMRAVVRPMGPGEIPAAVATDFAKLTRGHDHATRVEVCGRIDQVETRGNWLEITLVEGSARFDAYLPIGSELPPIGSRLRATGVPSRQQMNGAAAGGFALWLNGPEDLTILEMPPPAAPTPWWTTTRIVAAVTIPLAIAGIAFTWVATLRRRVQKQTAELREHFETQAELEEKLRTSQKLEAIGRLAGGIAHDFNNLLTVINGCGELLANDLAQNSPQRELAKDIRSAGERAASLVSQLLLFSRRQSVRLHTVDLRTTVKEAERILKRVIGETISVKCEIASDTPLVRAEPTLIHQVLLNLAVNARDAMPIGGTLHITAVRRETPLGCVAQLSISDTGVGMDEETRKRIFEPFFTTKGVGEGTGLGLATVYGIVQTIDGEIECRSALGQGTTFIIDIPADHATPILNGDGSASRPVTAGRGTILVCEDDDAVRDLTSRILETAGYEVLAAETPTDAARLAQNHNGRIELMLTDMVMPELNGRELADLVHPLRPDMRIVFMSGYTHDEMRRMGIAPDGETIISKPFSAAVLTAKINDTLSKTLQEFELPALVH